jgi:hypothetical protein
MVSAADPLWVINVSFLDRMSTHIQENKNKQQKQIPWPLVRKRTIPTDDRHLSAKFRVSFCG